MTKDSIQINGLLLPPGINADGSIAHWLAEQSSETLQAIDCGDRARIPNSTEKAHDGVIGRIELFQYFVTEYRRLLTQSIHVGIKNQWKEWDALVSAQDHYATMVGELGWEPTFHVTDREYRKRIIQLLQKFPQRPHNEKNLVRQMQQFYNIARKSWDKGGLCLNYPDDYQRDGALPELFTMAQVVNACQEKSDQEIGSCEESSRKVAIVMYSALSLYAPQRVDDLHDVYWWRMPKPGVTQSRHDTAHVFVGFQLHNGHYVAFDPSGVGLQVPDVRPIDFVVFAYFDIWRDEVANYHNGSGNTLVAYGQSKAAIAEYCKALRLNGADSHSYSGLSSAFAGQALWELQNPLIQIAYVELAITASWLSIAFDPTVANYESYEALKSYYDAIEQMRLPTFINQWVQQTVWQQCLGQ